MSTTRCPQRIAVKLVPGDASKKHHAEGKVTYTREINTQAHTKLRKIRYLRTRTLLWIVEGKFR